MVIVRFFRGQKGIIARVHGRVALPGREWRDRPPRDGEEWGVEITGENPPRTVWFLRPVASPEALRAAARWAAAKEFALREGLYLPEIIDALAASEAPFEKVVNDIVDNLLAKTRAEADSALAPLGLTAEDVIRYRPRTCVVDTIHDLRKYARLARDPRVQEVLRAIGASLEKLDFAGLRLDLGQSPEDIINAWRVNQELSQQEEQARERALRLAARVRQKVCECIEMETSDVEVRVITDEDWGLHEADPGFSVHVTPRLPQFIWASRQFGTLGSDIGLISRLVGVTLDPHEAAELEEDEDTAGEEGLGKAIYRLAEAIRPWRWIRVRVRPAPEVVEEIRRRYPGADDIVVDEITGYVRAIGGRIPVDRSQGGEK